MHPPPQTSPTDQTLPVPPNEQLGRRVCSDEIWDDKIEQGFADRLRYTHFLDKRSPDGLSVDRLGATSIEKKRSKGLTISADKDADKRVPKKIFNGWATIQCKKLAIGTATFHAVIDVLPDNAHHALIRNTVLKCADDLFAMSLCYLFQKHGGFCKKDGNA